jgi:hypothetical protein
MFCCDAPFKEKEKPVEKSVVSFIMTRHGWDIGGILKWIDKAEKQKAQLGAKGFELQLNRLFAQPTTNNNIARVFYCIR